MLLYTRTLYIRNGLDLSGTFTITCLNPTKAEAIHKHSPDFPLSIPCDKTIYFPDMTSYINSLTTQVNSS